MLLPAAGFPLVSRLRELCAICQWTLEFDAMVTIANANRQPKSAGCVVDKKRSGREVFDLRNTRFREYDLEGPVQPEMSWLPISYDKVTGQGCYAMRMAPGAVTIAHDHPGYEEFLILEGELIDDDGTVFKTGDLVSYKPGTHHNSRTDTGCLIAVFEWRPPPG